MDRYICIHGHFYQPPRENPWLEEIEIQDSAYPYHDWNERITAECYAPNATSRILDAEGRIVSLVNNYTKMSYNFGPTVLSWLEYHRPEVYRQIIEADRVSQGLYSGHGSAIAQVYNHVIMPLANTRDKRTQIYWGVRDFQKRFGRDPEGMWLAECAVDTETLDIMAEHGIKFTILAPWQGVRVRRLDDGSDWESVEWDRIDSTMAYLYRLPSGRTINLFYYNGPISYAIASAGLLKDGRGFADRLLGAFADRDGPQLVHIANDGESYGHHHVHGDMALAYCLDYIESNGFAKVTNFGEFLEKHPPTHEVELRESSSWSCIHGVERWRADCGCSSGLFPEWNQKWRGPLREVLDSLRDQLIPIYQHAAAKYLKDPWQARDYYIEVVFNRDRDNVEDFLQRNASRDLSAEEKVKTLKLLELQRYALYMYTSCGWFFDEVSGLEAMKVIEYAAKAIQLAEGVLGFSLEGQFLEELGRVPSNYDPNARVTYERLVTPEKIDLPRVGVHYAISSLFNEYPEHMTVYNFSADSEVYRKVQAGKLSLATGKAIIRSNITWDEKPFSFAALHLGDHNVIGGLREYGGDGALTEMQEEIHGSFERGDVTEIIQLIGKHFPEHNYSLWHLFRDEQRRVINQILGQTDITIVSSYRQIYDLNNPVMNFLSSLNIPIPEAILLASGHVVNLDIKDTFSSEYVDMEKLERLIVEATRWGVKIDKVGIAHGAELWATSLMEKVTQVPEDIPLFEKIMRVLDVLEPLSLDLRPWKLQNIYFLLREKSDFTEMQQRAKDGDEDARRWLEAFYKLGRMLKMKIDEGALQRQEAEAEESVPA